MELKNAIESRRSCREFSSKEIDKKIIEDLIDCARLSPSAANRQNWYFVILEKKIKNKVADIMEEELQKNKENIKSMETPTKNYTATSSLIGSIKVIREAPILILVFRKPDQDWFEGDYLSIGSAVEHIVLRATDLGLGSLWIRDAIYTKKEIAEVVGNDDMELVVSIAIGYQAEFPYTRRKKELKDIMRWY